MQNTKLPIATLDPVVHYYDKKDRRISIDFPLTYLCDYFFESTQYPIQTRDEYDWTGRTELLSVIESGSQNIQNVEQLPVFKPYVELARLNQLGTMLKALRGPAFTPDFCERLDIRPWREIEKDYEKFLIVPHPVWSEHLLNFLLHITPESISRVKCEKLFECLRNGRAKLIIQIPWEGGWWAPDTYARFTEWRTCLDLPETSIVFVMPLSKPAETRMKDWYGMNVHTFSYFEYFPREYTEEFVHSPEAIERFKQSLLKEVKLKYRFFNHTGCATPDRMGLLYLLDQLNSQWNISNTWGGNMKESIESIIQQIEGNKYYYCKMVGEERLEEVLSILKSEKQIECRQVFDSHNVEEDLWRYDSWIEVFCETIDRDYTEMRDVGTNCLHFMTEKTLKPLASMKPFMVLGNKGVLDDLHARGYKTFEPWICELYSQENTTAGRLLLAYFEMKRLNSLSQEEVEKMYKEMLPVLIHNFDLRVSKAQEGPQAFYNLLKEELDTL